MARKSNEILGSYSDRAHTLKVFACVLNENQKLELESFTSKDPITDAHVHPLVVNLRFDDSVTRAYEIVKALIVSRNSEINSLLAIVNNAAVTNPGPLEVGFEIDLDIGVN